MTAMAERTYGWGRHSFYNGTPGRELTTCPDCGHAADAKFGDHGGACLETVKHPAPNSALGIVRSYALDHARLSMNDLREQFIRAGVRKSARSQALIAGQKRGWIEIDGSIPSTSPGTKRSRVQVYRSLIVGTRPKSATR